MKQKANAGELAINKKSTDEVVTRVSTRQWAKSTNYEPAKIFNKLFNEDIKYLLSMSKLWEKRKAPEPMNWTDSLNDQTVPGVNDQQNGSATTNTTNGSEASNSNGNKKAELASHKIWSISECCNVFSQAVTALFNRLNESPSSENDDDAQQILCWDKDDVDAMNFVAAAANLRCFIFSIPVKSLFEIKCKFQVKLFFV
jgi:ubiquitin-like 1-activating enzyme E1 B